MQESKAPIQGETVKLEVSADQAKWSELYDVEVSRYPNKKSGYDLVYAKCRYVHARTYLRDLKIKFPPEKGWKHRVVKKTYAEISVTTLVKTEILKP